MNYHQALDYLFSQLPMFHRVGAPAYKANLDNTIALSEATGFPYRSFKTIHVAGTNGKGSVSHMLASALQESGLKTGLFTSPHLQDFRERIKVNGEMITQEYVTDFVIQHTSNFESIKPSFFEMTFALGMCYFKDMKVDIAVIETGMGGRLDSTNVITPELSIITNIGYDHMQFLGNTLKAIANEKAGIIKEGVPVVIGESNPETDDVFISKAKELNCSLVFADKVIQLVEQKDNSEKHESQKSGYKSWFIAKVNNLIIPTSDYHVTTEENQVTPEDNHATTEDYHEYIGQKVESPLTGEYQKKNIITAIAGAGLLKKYISTEGLIKGISNTLINTGLQGRWQTLSYSPLTICDIGHNSHGLAYVVSQIKKQKFKKLHFVFGAVNDKDISSILGMLSKDALYYFCRPDIPRGLDSSELAAQASAAGLVGTDCKTVSAAYHEAMRIAASDDMIFIGGSTFVVAEVLPIFNLR